MTTGYGGYIEGYDGDDVGGGDPPSGSGYAFVPPTFNIRINPDPVEVRSAGAAGLWRHYGGAISVGYSVVIKTDDSVTTYPGVAGISMDDINAAKAGNGENGIAWFRGGQRYVVDDSEKTLLEAAGYGSHITT